MIGTTFFTQSSVRFPRFDDLNFHRTWARTYENCTPSHKSGTMPEAPPAKEGSTSSFPLIVPFRTTVPTHEPVPTANSMRMRAATCLVGRGLDEETRGQEADVKRSVSTFGAYVITDCFRDVCVFVVCCRRSKILRKPMPSTKEKRRQQQRARREKLFLAQRRHLTSCSFTHMARTCVCRRQTSLRGPATCRSSASTSVVSYALLSHSLRRRVQRQTQ